MMNRGAWTGSVGLALMMLAGAASAQSVDELKRELEAKRAEVARLEQQVRELEQRSAVNGLGPAANDKLTVQSQFTAPPEFGPEDDDEMERALERTLVREGSLVLSPYTYEITPQVSFAHWDTVQNPFVRNSYSAALSARIGLPWQSQLSFSLPYIYNDLRFGGSSSGFGDAGFLFSKELLRESHYGFGLVGSVGWTSPTSKGAAFDPIPYVSGFQGGLNASKKLDPLVVFGGVSYFSSMSRDVAGTLVDPSDVIGTRVGGSLAVSPSTSVTMGLSTSYLLNAEPLDFIVPNSDRLLSTVDVTFSTIVGPRMLLNVTGQFGITGNVPDYRLITSLPIRF